MRTEKQVVEQIVRLVAELEEIRMAKRSEAKVVHRCQVSGLMARVETGVVTFVKKNQEIRRLKFEIDRHLIKNIDFSTQYLTVWDEESSDYRKVNLNTVMSVETPDKVVYRVR